MPSARLDYRPFMTTAPSFVSPAAAVIEIAGVETNSTLKLPLLSPPDCLLSGLVGQHLQHLQHVLEPGLADKCSTAAVQVPSMRDRCRTGARPCKRHAVAGQVSNRAVQVQRACGRHCNSSSASSASRRKPSLYRPTAWQLLGGCCKL